MAYGQRTTKTFPCNSLCDKLTRSFYDGALQIIKDTEYNFRDIFPDSSLAAINSKDETIDLAKVKRFKTLTCRSVDSGLTGATRCEVLAYADDMVSGSGEAMNRERMDILWTKFCNDKEYIMEYTGNSVRQFEAIGGSTSGMQNKIFTSIDGLIYVGLMKHHLGMNYNLAKKISDSAIEEYGASEIYPVLAEKFTEVFMKEGFQGKKKSFLISEIKPTKKALNSEQ